jgi:FRG domain
MWIIENMNSWQKATRVFAQGIDDPVGRSYLYRGQSDADWGLVDSLSRLLPKDIRGTDALRIEAAARQRFSAQAHLFIDPSLLPEDRSHTTWWALMQHFRAPTRLLDWTTSPWVALYFAVVDHWEKPGAIWCYPPNWLTRPIPPSLMNKDSDEIDWDDRRLMLDPDAINFIYSLTLQKRTYQRVVSQQGYFTAPSRIPSDHAQLIDETLLEPEHTYFTKYLIKPAAKPMFMKHLLRMNITANTLFPGLDGLGLSIRELVKLSFSK